MAFVTEVVLTTGLFIVLALIYWGAIIAVLRFSPWQAPAGQAAAVAVLPGLGLFALALPVFLFSLNHFWRPGIDTLADLLFFESTAALGFWGLAVGALVVGAVAALLVSRRGEASRLSAVGMTLGLVAGFIAITAPLWNQIYACTVGSGLLFSMAC